MKHFILGVLCLLTAIAPEQKEEWHTSKSGLKYTILKEGTGPQAKLDQEVEIHESTRYRDGSLLFTSEGMPPLRFKLGSKTVIAGVEEGIQGMRQGEIRKLIVPPDLSKRTSYPAILHKDSILVYRIELMSIIK